MNDFEIIGDSHFSVNMQTPMLPESEWLNETDKMEQIEFHFAEIMKALGLDLADDSLKGTPRRVAKMYVQEIFRGLDPSNQPILSVFDNKYEYNKMLLEKDITFESACEHHFLPMRGKAHVAYISSGKVIGISKINRLVDYYARRPQVQERLTLQICNALKDALNTEDVIVFIEAEHLCVTSRGVDDKTSRTSTIAYGGKFEEMSYRQEFMQYLNPIK
ncbi:MAG: GTP cyclohydrolase I FolE [Crocinitomicaceae bacterium]|jgi:GTP cyclohydrolase I|nr:GTP cyclohydrolase I FolE [Crocinitomicaceae bacterium]